MTYLKNALSHIANEEQSRSPGRRLTSLQKNRIALKYIKFRENQNVRATLAEAAASKKVVVQPRGVKEVTGGYDEAIEMYSNKQ